MKKTAVIDAYEWAERLLAAGWTSDQPGRWRFRSPVESLETNLETAVAIQKRRDKAAARNEWLRAKGQADERAMLDAWLMSDDAADQLSRELSTPGGRTGVESVPLARHALEWLRKRVSAGDHSRGSWDTRPVAPGEVKP